MKKTMPFFLKHFLLPASLIALCSFLFFPSAQAATISKVKKKRVLIVLDGEPAQKGDYYYAVNSKGKKRALLKIKKINKKGTKAIARLVKGRLKVGWSVINKAHMPKKVAKKRQQPTRGTSYTHWGATAGYLSHSLSVTLLSGEKTEMTGSGFTVKALMDYALFDVIWFRGQLGLMTIDAEGDGALSGCNNLVCSTSIQYISFDLWGRWLLSQSSSFRPWIGGGFDLLFPMSKESTALDPTSITNTNVIAVGGGFDWYLDAQSYIPFQVEYAFFPQTDDVSANYIGVSVGYVF